MSRRPSGRLRGSQNPISQQDRQKILDLYAAGKSLEQAAVAVGRSYNTAWRVVDLAGVMRRAQLYRLTPAQERAVIAAWRERRSVRAVARDTGHKPSTVHRVLFDHKIDTTPGPSRQRSAWVDVLVRLYTEDGLSVRQVAQHVGRAYGTVYNALDDRGVLRRRNPIPSRRA